MGDNWQILKPGHWSYLGHSLQFNNISKICFQTLDNDQLYGVSTIPACFGELDGISRSLWGQKDETESSIVSAGSCQIVFKPSVSVTFK